MKVEIEKSYPMPAPAEATWALLQDIEAVAGCMPGAKITERLDAGRYKGTVTVKLGPATMAFRGEVEMKDVDPAAMTLRLLGKGTDSTGSSVATMNLTARVEAAEAGRSTLVGSERGVDERQGGNVRRTDDEHGRRPGAEAVRRQLRGPGRRDRRRQRAVARRRGRCGAGAAAAAPHRPAPRRAPPAAELNGLALAWAVFANWLRGLFGKKTA